MKYAVIADIHANMPAFEAVLQDAREQGAERFLFLGDYCNNFSQSNEVLTRLRSMKDAVIIRGNDDGHVLNLIGQNQETWTDGQFCTVYWTFRSISPENLSFLAALPEEAELLLENGIPAHCIHKPHQLFSGTILEYSCPEYARDRNRFSSREEHLNWLFSSIEKDQKLGPILDALPDGVYLFAHTHMQWHLRLGGKLILNPGSCGLPLDGIPVASYTLLTCDSDGLHVEERRCHYDLDKVITALKSSPLYGEATLWSDIMIKELRTGIENVGFFLPFAEKYARSVGDTTRPFTKETWAAAYAAWPDQP